MSIRPLDTFICTPDKIVRIGKLKPGDIIFDPLGNHIEVTGVKPHDPIEFYQITFDDGRTVSVCAEQKLVVQYYQNDRRYVARRLLSDIMEDYRLPIEYDQKYLYKYFIPTGTNVKFNYRDCPMNPYVAGVMLNAAHPYAKQLTLSHIAAVVVERVCMICGLRYQFDPDTGDYLIFDQKHRKVRSKRFLKPLKIYKVPMRDRVPNVEYAINDLNVVSDFLQGYIDSSRYTISSPPEYVPMYATTSKIQYQFLLFINRSLGIKTFVEKDANDVYVQYIPKYAIPPFTSLMIKDIRSIGRKECISITTSDKNDTYLSDDFVPIPISD